MQWYNLTQIDGSSPVNLILSVNANFTNHILGLLILLVIFAICIISFIGFNNNPKISLMISSGITALLSILFAALGLISTDTKIIFVIWIIFIGSVVWVILDSMM